MLEKPEEHFVGLVAQKAIISHEGKILFVRNKGDARWDFPGGRLNLEESPSVGLLRELKEELGANCIVASVVHVGQYWHGAANKPCVFINYEVEFAKGETINLAADELSEFQWLEPTQLQSNETFPNCIDSLAAHQSNQNREEEEHFKGKVALKAIVARAGKILLMQDPREKRSIWELPGGRMNLDEEPKAALVRECFEELGVKLEVGEVVHVQQFIQGYENAVAMMMAYEAKLTDPNAPFVLASNEVSEVGWFSEEEIDSLQFYPEHAAALKVYFKTKQP